jgi:flagellar hook-basal body complex protein FliE
MIAALPIVGSVVSTLAPMLSSPTTAAAATTTNTTSITAGSQDFGQMIAQLSNNTIDSLKNSEATSIQSIQGKVGIQSVVESVMSAQESLQTALAIRDKAVAAFQEVSRMAI